MTREHTRRGVAVVAVVLVVGLAAVTPVAAVGLDDDTGTGVGDTLDSSDPPTTDTEASNGTDASGSANGTADSDRESADSDDETPRSSGSESPDSGESNSSESEAAGSPESNGTDDSGSDEGSTGADDGDESGANESGGDGWSDRGDEPALAANASVESAGDALDGAGIPEVPALANATAAAGAEGLTEGDARDDVADATGVGTDDAADTAGGAVDAVGSAVEGVVSLSGTDALLGDAFDGSGSTFGPVLSGDASEPSVGRDTPAAGAESGGQLLGLAPAAGSDAGVPAPGPAPAGAAIGAGAVAAAAAARSGVLPGANAGLGATLAGALAPVSARSSALLDRLTRLFAPLRYSRYDDSDPLEHEAREEVFGVVEERPGAYLSEVAERADLPLSTTRHHIRVLEREDLVSGAKVRGKRRFYPAHTSGMELTAALNDEATASVLDALARIGAASVSDLADELGRDPSTISHHLQRLADADVIVRKREGRAVINQLAPEARTALEPETGVEQPVAEEAVAGGAD